jgi:ketosteroid isomerase-like protein
MVSRKDEREMNNQNISDIRAVLQKFQDAYTARDLAKLDEFMQLFVQDDSIEMIGIGASKRAAAEWFEGVERIREIVESDWKYWGDVRLDVDNAKITVHGDVAWLSTTGTVTQAQAFDTAIQFHLNDMKAIFDQEGLSADEKLMEATHYGMRRLRERAKGLGYSWPFTFTAILVKEGVEWRFHTLHWAMPVD